MIFVFVCISHYGFAADGTVLPASFLEIRDQQDDGYGQDAGDKTGDIAAVEVRSIGDGIEDQGPPGDEGEVEGIHEAGCDGTELEVMGGEVGHPRVPEGLGCVGGAHEVEREEVAGVGFGVGDEDGAGDDEGEADAEGGLPARTEFVGDVAVDEGGEDSGAEDGRGVVVLLDDRVAAGRHPELHDVVADGLDDEGVDYVVLLAVRPDWWIGG